MLSVANMVGLVGTTAYFYKQMEAMRGDMLKLSQSLTGLARSLAELRQGDQSKTDSLHNLTDQIKQISQKLEDAPSLGELDQDLDTLVEVLREQNIQAERPSQTPKTRRGKQSRRRVRRDDDSDDGDLIGEVRRQQQTRSS